MKMKPSGILDGAANVIERNGWVQGDWWMTVEDDAGIARPIEECPMCAGGAINASATFAPDYDDHYDGPTLAALEAFATHVRFNGAVPDWAEVDALDEIGQWNDEPGRTVGEVVAALRAVAEKEREAGR